MALVYIMSCDNNTLTSENNSASTESNLTKAENIEIPTEFLGNYHGIQPGYYMKNQFGDDVIINGNKVSIPSIDYKFLIKENNIVSLQQINLEDNDRVYYDGKSKIISNNADILKIECSLSDGQSSNPTYILTINKITKEGLCNGGNEPEFTIEKIK
jgi:hypothetical protein